MLYRSSLLLPLYLHDFPLTLIKELLLLDFLGYFRFSLFLAISWCVGFHSFVKFFLCNLIETLQLIRGEHSVDQVMSCQILSYLAPQPKELPREMGAPQHTNANLNDKPKPKRFLFGMTRQNHKKCWHEDASDSRS